MRKGRYSKIKYLICILTVFFVSMTVPYSVFFDDSQIADSVFAADKDSTMIRVGLEGVYYNKQSVNIRNADIVIGYSVDNSYYREMSVSGGSFTFTPFTGNISLSGSYSSYGDAKTAALAQSSGGVEAYPVLTYLNSWSVALCGSGSEDGYAVMVSASSGEKFLYTVDGHGAYPQISAGKSNASGVYVVDMGERQYRGRIEIGRYGEISSLKAVNIVELEEYLYGVVPCEMVSSWHSEALKTQAVCSRSYAYTAGFGSGTDLTKPYSLCDTTSSQVYKGYGAERTSTNNAVDETEGEIIYYNGKPVRAYYSSTSGGSTENVEDVWGTPYGYLRQVSDIYELEPELRPWVIELTAGEVESLLEENGVSVGKITDIRPFVMTQSGRVYSVEIQGDSKQIITGDKLRKIFSLYSTKYKVIKYNDNPDYVAVLTDNGKYALDIADSYIAGGDFAVNKASGEIEQFVVMTADNLINYPANAPSDGNTYYIAGMGYGHGVGMSQSGAKGMAEAGFTYKQILKHYYTGIEVR